MSALDPKVEAALAVWFEANDPWYAGMANDVVETCRTQMRKALEAAPSGQATLEGVKEDDDAR